MKNLRLISILLCLALLLTSCSGKKKQNTTDTPSGEQTEKAPELTGYINPLTGERTLETEAQTKLRPVAVAINNQTGAQKVQTGLNSADIIYETYVEGGITRLLAVYKDISKVGELGTVRSARYNFVDLACGDDALYVHAGMDPTYCKPYLNKLGLDNINLLLGNYYGYAYRLDNGLALEHTLYSKGENLAKMISDYGIRTTVSDFHSGNWMNFKETASPLPGGNATKITAKFSGSYISTFHYDAATDSYKKQNHNDWRGGDALSVKNVVVLFTDVKAFDSTGYRVNVSLKSGSGYYFSNGTFQQINWVKGNTYERFRFTDTEGKAVAYNPGNTWVCIVNNGMRNQFVME